MLLPPFHVASVFAWRCPLELLDWLAENQFVSPTQADELRPQATFPDSHSLAKELIRRDWLTPFKSIKS